MFTGIIEEIGEVLAVERTEDTARMTVRSPNVVHGLNHGDSIAVSGVCLTVVDRSPGTVTADVMAETFRVSTLDELHEGDLVNLERALLVDARLGGHIVQGHVDAISTLLSTTTGEAWDVLRFSLSPEIASLVVQKGSVAVDGVSLTVSTVSQPHAPQQWFEVSLIPETLAATTLGMLRIGDRVNVETDILGRQIHRLLAASRTSDDTPTFQDAPAL